MATEEFDNPLPGNDPITFKVAATPAERHEAFQLVHDSYVRAGLIDPNAYRLRVTQYHLRSETTVFIAQLRNETICTVTLIPDSEGQLPMEEIFPEEVARIRDQGMHVGEVSCLADRRCQIERILPVFVELTKVMAQYSIRQGMGGFVIAVHPRHARFYQRLMGFQVISDERTYPLVNDRPAIACFLDFEDARVRIPSCYRRFFGKPIAEELLTCSPWTEEERLLYEEAAACCHGCLAINDF